MVSGCQRYDFRPMDDRKTVSHDDEAASRLANKRSDGGFDFAVTMNWGSDGMHIERSSRSRTRVHNNTTHHQALYLD